MLRGARAKHQRARPGESGAIVLSFANITVQRIVFRVSAEPGRFDKWGAGAALPLPVLLRLHLPEEVVQLLPWLRPERLG